MPGFTIKKSAPSATSRSCQNVKIFSQLNFNKEHNRILDHLYQCFLTQKTPYQSSSCLERFSHTTALSAKPMEPGGSW